jgi:predicted  nucleic acid-binding Zn-ribbon protein
VVTPDAKSQPDDLDQMVAEYAAADPHFIALYESAKRRRALLRELAEKRQEQARNNRETEATTRELEVLKREKEERTAEADRLAQVVVEVNASIIRHEGDFSELAKHLADEEAVARGRREDLVGRKRAMEDERKAISSRVRADILRIYTMAFTRRGSGVSECTGGVCRGCHVTLPPQLFNQILRADRVYQCPNCNRILLVPRAANPR